MHRTLQIVEVVRAIVDHIPRDEQTTLLSMGLTCRAFFDLAMDALWEHLNMPEPLFWCLPAHTRGEDLETLTVIKPPSEAEWARFDMYARRVKHLEIHPWAGLEEDEEIALPSFESLRHYHPGPFLLPNLQRFESTFEDASQCYPYIFTPTLKIVEVHLGDDENVQDLCDALDICSGSLETFDTFQAWSEMSSAGRGQLARAITRMSSLKRLATIELPPETLTYLATLPTLESLSVESGPQVYPSRTTFKFKFLRELTLTCGFDDAVPPVSILDAGHFPALTSLTLQFKADGPLDSTARLFNPNDFSALATRVARLQGLQTLNISLSNDSEPPIQLYPSLPQLSLLFSLRDLQDLDLSTIPFTVNPTDTVQIASAWPKLRTLHIGVFRPSLDTPNPLRMEHLLPFAERCPALDTLGLPLDFTYPPEPAHILPLGKSSSRLRVLECGIAQVRSSALFARFVAGAFPLATLKRSEFHTSFSPAFDGAVGAINETKEIILDAFRQGQESRA